MLSTVQIIVAPLADSGVGTLRAAITQANANTANQYVIAWARLGFRSMEYNDAHVFTGWIDVGRDDVGWLYHCAGPS